MSDSSKIITALPTKGSVYDANDALVFIYNVSGANNTGAQTALVSVRNLVANTPNLQVVCANLQVGDIRGDLANSTEIVIPAGTLFFSSNFGYYAKANNVVVRWPLSSF